MAASPEVPPPSDVSQTGGTPEKAPGTPLEDVSHYPLSDEAREEALRMGIRPIRGGSTDEPGNEGQQPEDQPPGEEPKRTSWVDRAREAKEKLRGTFRRERGAFEPTEGDLTPEELAERRAAQEAEEQREEQEAQAQAAEGAEAEAEGERVVEGEFREVEPEEGERAIVQAGGEGGEPPERPPTAEAAPSPEESDGLSVEIRGLLEKARQGDPETAVVLLQRLDNLEAQEREDRVEVYNQVCELLAKFAHKEKLLGLDAKYVAAEEDLEEMDKVAIDQVETQNPGQGLVLKGLLDQLDAAEEEIIRVNNTLGDDQFEGLFSERAWEQLKKTKEKLAEEKANFEREIADRTDPGFLASRVQKKAVIEQVKEGLEAATREEREKTIREQRAEPEDWEMELERLLLEDVEPTLTQPARSTFSEQLEFYQQQPNSDPAKEGLSWYFHEARRLGIFEDLEERLAAKYREWANSLMPHREVSQLDMLTDSPGRIIQKTFAEVEDQIIEYFNTILDPDKSSYVEQSARWNIFQRRGLSPADSTRLQGIRAEFTRRAQAQIEDSLSNLDRESKGLPVIPPPGRISGEWNVYRLERGITERRERQALEVGMEPLFREESYYRIRLLGTTRKEIELGADQAAENIIQSATTFDIQAIQQRMEMLLKALREKSTDLQRSEGISESEANTLIQLMEDAVTDKIDFFILDWAGQNLQMGLFSDYLEQRMRIRGVEKLRRIPAINDGLVGKAIILLLSEQNRLYHRPQGFKGQQFDDDTTHKYIRSKLKGQIVGRLMEYDLKGRSDQERNQSREKLIRASSMDQFLSNFELKNKLINGKEFKDLTDGELRNLRISLENLTPAQRDQIFDTLAPRLRVEIRRSIYEQISEEVRQKGERGEATLQDLKQLRAFRHELALEQSRLQEVERRANSAFTIAHQVLNIFGEAAELGAPSIIMDNGDFIRVNDVSLVYKHAILQAAKKYGEKYGAEDNPALIRWRSRMWIDRWKKAGLDRTKASRDFEITLKNGKKMTLRLKAGFEETGLTEEEWQALEEADKELRAKGYCAEFNGIKFEDIIKMDHLKPVMNNFLADYKSSESQINNEVVLEQVAKGRLVPIRKILNRLGVGREGIKGRTTQQRIDNLTQMIEDSRALDAELERLVYFVATHGFPQEGEDPRDLSFSPDRTDYGFQGLSWGVKRLHHLKAFWYTNLRRTVPRAVDVLHALPFSQGPLSKEMDFDHILDLAWNINTSLQPGMESVDNPALTLFAQRHKDLVYLRSVCEGDLVDAGGKLSKVWGFLEKPLVDANAMWKLFGGVSLGFSQVKESLASKESDKDPAMNQWRESMINALWGDGGSGHLGRFGPIVHGTEKLLAVDRQALSSGAGYEENEKFALRFLEWLTSAKRASEEQGAREEAGMEAYSEVVDIIRTIIRPNSYREGSSIWDEVWRKLTPSHNIRLPHRTPSPTYVPVTT